MPLATDEQTILIEDEGDLHDDFDDDNFEEDVERSTQDLRGESELHRHLRVANMQQLFQRANRKLFQSVASQN